MKNKPNLIKLSLTVIPLMVIIPAISQAEEATTETADAPTETYTGTSKLGLGIVSMDDNKNHKYGEYTGIEDDESHLILNFDLLWQVDSAYMEAEGSDLGLDSRRSRVETGQYGNFALEFEHQQIPHLESTNAATPLTGVGTNRLRLPAGFVTAGDTSGMTNLSSSLNDVTVRTDRKKDSINYSNFINPNLKLVFGFQSETKEGTQSMGGTMGQNGGLTDSMILPAPVDYQTDEFSAKIAYSKNKTQIEGGYYFSKFRNEYDSVTWDNPFLNVAPPFFPIPPIPYPSVARTSLPVDNEHHRFNVNVGTSFGNNMRFSGLVEIGKMTQDEEFLPYSTDDASLVIRPLPRDSAEAEVETKHVNLNLTGRPSNKLSWRGKYRYYKFDNKTPQDFFYRVVDDTVPQTAEPPYVETNNPNHAYDYEQNKISLDGTFRIMSGMSTNLGYEVDKIERTHREIDETEEKTIKAKLKSRLGKNMTGTISASNAKREGDEYNPYQAYFDGHSQDFINSQAPGDQMLNHFAMRKYDIADRERDIYGIQLDYFIGLTTDLGVFYQQQKDEYTEDLLGMTEYESTSYGLDINFSPVEGASVFFNYTREEIETEQWGLSFTAAGPPGTRTMQANDLTRLWLAEHEDEIDTYEIGANYRIWEEKLTLKFSYLLAEAKNSIDFAHDNVAVFGAPAADISGEESKRQNLRLAGEYHKTENLGIEVGLEYEKLDYGDWQKAGIEAGGTAIADVLPLTGEIPDNEVYFIYTTVNYKW